MNKPDAIFFDWNGTLSDSFFWQHLKESTDQEERALYNKWDQAMFSGTKEEINEWMRGRYSTEEWVKRVALQTGSDYQLVLDEFITGAKSMSIASFEALDLIRALQKNGVKAIIATNNMDSFTRWTVPALGLNKIFDHIINSYDQKGLKHERDQSGQSIFFRETLERFSIDPSRALFIDDSTDKEGYISGMGMKYIQIKSSADVPMILAQLV